MKPNLSNRHRTLLLTLLSAFIIFAGTVQYRQYTHYARGVAAESRGEMLAALSGYEAAIHFHTPFSPFVQRSAERIRVIAEAAERRGDLEFALIAYRALRSSFYAARSLYLPGEKWIQLCNGRIVDLEQRLKSLPAASGGGGG